MVGSSSMELCRAMSWQRKAWRSVHNAGHVQVAREGTKKTVFTNFMELCKAMNRQLEHVQLFLLAELGTSGNLDGQSRLIVKGRFLPKAFEGVLRRYVNECALFMDAYCQLVLGSGRLWLKGFYECCKRKTSMDMIFPTHCSHISGSCSPRTRGHAAHLCA